MVRGRIKAVLVVAPAGYGKSTLMAQWFESLRGEQEAQASWLNLDENDNDPERLLHYLIAALQAAIPELRRDPTLDFQAPVTTEAKLDALGARLADFDRKLVLFIDDAHVLADGQALQVFEWLVRFAGDSLRFVIGCRQVPRVGMPELRLRGELVELDQSAMAFTTDEVESFWHERQLGPLDRRAFATLLEKTEGWAAVIELLTLALNEEPNAAKLIADFSATERGVVEYLGEVVFGRLAAQQREQIHRLAQFDRFCAELALQACGPGVPDDLLAELQRRRLFVIPLDRKGQWFRFHHLVRDYLRRQLPRGLADTTRQTLLAGGQWFHDNGMPDDAIDCAVRAQAWDQACQWLAASIGSQARRMGSGTSVARWMPLIPREQIDRYPQIRISYMSTLAYHQEKELLQRELADFESLIHAWERSGGRDANDMDAMRSTLALHRLMWRALSDGGVDMLPHAQAWLERWPQARPRMLGDALIAAAYACKTAGEIDRGIDYASRARQTLSGHGGPFGVSRSMLVTAVLWLKRGDYRAAQSVSEEGLRFVAEKLNRHPEHMAYHHAVLSAVQYEFDDMAQAVKELESELAAVDATGIADVLILIYLTRARLQFLQGERDAGLEALSLGRRLGVRRELPRLTITLAAEECTWLCRFGEQAAALDLARQFGFDRREFTGYDLLADKAARIGPRLLLAKSPEQALVQLEPAIVRSREKGFHHRHVELLILQAMALVRSGREADAAGAWAAALELGERFGYRRVFLDDAEMVATLSQAARGRKEVPRPAWLQARPKAVLLESDEQLTRKELRILKHLDSGRSNGEIAESLFISEGTLKWHLRNLYRKLGCKNRSGAIAAARRRGVIENGPA
ncbi:hypothetical protein UC35_18165 [Ramlibacter tataouinensis]|uniref:HTH luxR-type domain-containing protein n=1 Tax=Ramlibacter tataouinensis TaxID=94132 RepID=A0A127JWX5_9BURK|nr:hypothetical protein UC35_18165 [Ramlibacter tataouinensis]